MSFRVPENVTFSKDFGQFLLQFTDLYQKLATASNSKDIALYDNNELIDGQQFFGANPQTKHQIYRKVVECGALPNAATKPVPHGIAGVSGTWMFTRVYGMARNPVAVRFVPLPNVGAQQIALTVDATNINLITIADLSAYTYSVVILEYWKF